MDSELGAVVDLMFRSELYRSLTVADLQRLVVPPIELKQRSVIVDRGNVLAWGSWAFLSEVAETGFVCRTRKLQPEDWRSGRNIWLIDAIAPYGHGRQLISMIRSSLRQAGHKGEYMQFIRRKADNLRYSRVML